LNELVERFMGSNTERGRFVHFKTLGAEIVIETGITFKTISNEWFHSTGITFVFLMF